MQLHSGYDVVDSRLSEWGGSSEAYWLDITEMSCIAYQCLL